MNRLVKISALALALVAGTAQAGPIGIGGFSGSETVTTFNNLGLPFNNATPLLFDGNTYTTDQGGIRYADTFDADCTLQCIGNNTDLGWIDVVLGAPTNRAGARVGGANVNYAGRVDFFDTANNLLGSVTFGNNPGLVFVGWEDLSVGIGRVRFNDTAANARILHIDDFRFEAANGVPVPGTLALAGLALLGMGCVRRRQAA